MSPVARHSTRMCPYAVASGRPRGRLTRIRPVARRLVLPSVASARNKRPDIDPEGLASHRRTSRPRIGNAEPKVAPNRATRRRLVVRSKTMSKRPTDKASCPRRWQILRARRNFRSSGASVPCASPMVDFASTISAVRVASCHPSTSIDPRSPNSLKVTSNAVCQPASRMMVPAFSTRSAWASSSKRSRPSPRHRTRTSRSAPRAVQRRSIRRISAGRIRPRSTFETNGRETPAATARSSWRHPCRTRIARIDRPMRRRSTAPILGDGALRGLT